MAATGKNGLESAIAALPPEAQARYLAEYHLGAARAASGDTQGGEHGLEKYYTFDELGHIMFVTTSHDTAGLSQRVQETFQKVIVFFGALTKALAQKGKTIMHYKALNSIISSSGVFVSVQKESRTFTSGSTTVSLNTSIITHVLGSAISGGALEIAKRTLAAIGGALNSTFKDEGDKTEIAHLLFVCESLMGMPIVSISLFHAKVGELRWLQKTNCDEIYREKKSFEYDGDHYLFVDPTYIKKFTSEFEESEEYKEFVDQLAGYIEDEPKGE